MLSLLGGGDLDEDSWGRRGHPLLIADLCLHRRRSRGLGVADPDGQQGVRTEADTRAVREVLISELRPDLDR